MPPNLFTYNITNGLPGKYAKGEYVKYVVEEMWHNITQYSRIDSLAFGLG